MMKSVQNRLNAINAGAKAKYAALAVAASPAIAFAADQPDVEEATTYIAAGVVTILAVFGAKYVVKGAILLGRWVQGVIGR